MEQLTGKTGGKPHRSRLPQSRAPPRGTRPLPPGLARHDQDDSSRSGGRRPERGPCRHTDSNAENAPNTDRGRGVCSGNEITVGIAAVPAGLPAGPPVCAAARNLPSGWTSPSQGDSPVAAPVEGFERPVTSPGRQPAPTPLRRRPTEPLEPVPLCRSLELELEQPPEHMPR